jgi:hypothetical protein
MLSIDNVPEPKLIRRLVDSKDALILTLPGIGQQVVVQGGIKCAESGTILLKKL